RVVQHGAQKAALDQAGWIAELTLSFESDADPTQAGFCINQMPAQELRAWRDKNLFKCGGNHSAVSSSLTLQLHFFRDSESMCRQDSEVMDGVRIDRDNA